MARKKKYNVTFSKDCETQLRSADIEGETFISTKDFLKYLLKLESNNYSLNNKGFVLNRLTKEFNLNSVEFWNDSENKPFFKLILSKLNNSFSEWYISSVITTILKSNVEDDLKCELLNTIKSIPSKIHKEQLLDKNVSPQVKLSLFNFNTDTELLTTIALTEENKRVLSKALHKIDIKEVNDPKIKELLIKEENLSSSDRIQLIESCNNPKLLQELLLEEENFEVVKAVRKRIKNMPQSIDFINGD